VWGYTEILLIFQTDQLYTLKVFLVNGVFISTVNFNPEFWSSVLPKLEAFYNDLIPVELTYSLVKYSLSRLDLRGC